MRSTAVKLFAKLPTSDRRINANYINFKHYGNIKLNVTEIQINLRCPSFNSIIK
jgi:hypothetical protein